MRARSWAQTMRLARDGAAATCALLGSAWREGLGGATSRSGGSGAGGDPTFLMDVVGHGPSDGDHHGPEARVGSQDPVVAMPVEGTDAKRWPGGGTRRARRWSSSRGVRRSAWRPCRSGSGRR